MLREALADEASLRATLRRLRPPSLGVAPELLRSVNTPDGARVSDVAVIGGGIVGCALAAFLAEGGAETVLYEREAIAAGASGRNSGVVQHPLDAELIGLYEESLTHYRELEGFELPEEPVGLLLLGADASAASRSSSRRSSRTRAALEPALAPGIPRDPARDRPPGPARGRRARVGGTARGAPGRDDHAIGETLRRRRPRG